MKKFAHTIMLLSLVMISTGITAQTLSPRISFHKTEHDFGSIKEADGKVETVFEFKNLGEQPLMIKNVSSSCGCTTPTYSREPILPGKSGQIKAVFDPRNRPGKFVKHITVYTNADNKPITLTLNGSVIKREPTVADKYPYSFSDLRLNKSHISFLKMSNREVKENTVRIINTSNSQSITVGFERVPDHITISSSPETLKPGEAGNIKIKYDATKVEDWGFKLDGIFIKQNGKVNYNNKLSVSVTLEEDFSDMTPAEKAKAPVIKFDNTTLNFDSISQGEKIEHEFAFRNNGQSNLLIRKVKATCGCTAIKPEKTVVGPGEASSIKVVFDSRGKKGRQYKTVSIITNAPNQPNTVLKIIGTVN